MRKMWARRGIFEGEPNPETYDISVFPNEPQRRHTMLGHPGYEQINILTDDELKEEMRKAYGKGYDERTTGQASAHLGFESYYQQRLGGGSFR